MRRSNAAQQIGVPIEKKEVTHILFRSEGALFIFFIE
jgi:hypothetical protein